MSQKELISVLMPVYNSDKYVKEAVKSILNQTYTNFEFIIIDDGSTDNSVSIIKQFNDTRIKLLIREHKGIVDQLNFGLKEAKGEFIARMDADDLCSKERLEKQINLLLRNKDVQLVGTNHYFINETGKVIAYKKLPESHNDIEFMMPILTSVVHASLLMHKAIFIDGYVTGNDSVEDYDIFLKLLQNGVRFYNIQEFLYSYRMLNNSVSQLNTNTILRKSYPIGCNYINKKYPKDSYNYNVSMGMLEYYKGDIIKARYYFKEAKKLSSNKIMMWRYLILTYLGNNLLGFLRRGKILWKLSFFINRVFKIDFHLVKNKM